MDSTAIHTFEQLFRKALITSPSNDNGFGLALGTILGFSALVICALIVYDRRTIKAREKQDEERKAEKIEDRRLASEAVNKAELRAVEDRERSDRAAREQRERDEASVRDRAKADQADREQAREKLMQHVDTVIDRLTATINSTIGKLEAAIGALQSESKDHHGNIVLLKKDVEELKEDLDELSKSKSK